VELIHGGLLSMTFSTVSEPRNKILRKFSLMPIAVVAVGGAGGGEDGGIF
jgi:hypothetical protein